MSSTKLTSIKDFSEKFIRYQKLPYGTSIRLYRGTGKKVRSDYQVKRKKINSKNIGVISPSDNVSCLLKKAKEMLNTDLDARKLHLELYGPDETFIHGNTMIKSVRELEPIESTDDTHACDLFLTLLDNNELGDISLRDAGRLYVALKTIVGKELDVALNRNEYQICNGLV